MKASSDSKRSALSVKRFRFLVWTVAGVLEMDANEAILVGRVPTADAIWMNLSTYDAEQLGISRQHALIRPEDDGYMLRDLGSTNGTFLNGLALEAHRSYPLQHQDELRFGQLSMQIFFLR